MGAIFSWLTEYGTAAWQPCDLQTRRMTNNTTTKTSRHSLQNTAVLSSAHLNTLTGAVSGIYQLCLLYLMLKLSSTTTYAQIILLWYIQFLLTANHNISNTRGISKQCKRSKSHDFLYQYCNDLEQVYTLSKDMTGATPRGTSQGPYTRGFIDPQCLSSCE